jgi:hypothetical protein
MLPAYIAGCEAGASVPAKPGYQGERNMKYNGMKELMYSIVAAVLAFFGTAAFAGFVESVQ